jgi:hypothetical protein
MKASIPPPKEGRNINNPATTRRNKPKNRKKICGRWEEEVQGYYSTLTRLTCVLFF